MTDELRIGVVGTGVMGRRHAQVIADHPGLTLVGVADTDQDTAREVATETGSDPFASHESLYEELLDAVVIATPETAHKEPTLDAAEYGYDVLLEKPVAQKRTEAADIRAAVERANISVLIGFILRFDAKYGSVRTAVDEGSLGEIASIRAERSVVASEARRLSRSHPLLYQTIHDIDLARGITGSDVVTVHSTGVQRMFDGENYDTIFSTLTFGGGTIASIETSSILPEESPAPNRARLSIKGTEGTAEIAAPGNDVEVCTEHTSYPDVSICPTVNERAVGALRNEIDHFIDVVRDGVEPIASLEDGLQAGETARACRRALKSDEPVTVEPIPGGDYE